MHDSSLGSGRASTMLDTGTLARAAKGILGARVVSDVIGRRFGRRGMDRMWHRKSASACAYCSEEVGNELNERIDRSTSIGSDVEVLFFRGYENMRHIRYKTYENILFG